MIPTEQDKELRDLLITLFESGKELSDMYSKYDGDKDWSDWLSEILPKTDLYQLLTADRKRVALEARIDEATLGLNLSGKYEHRQHFRSRIDTLKAERNKLKEPTNDKDS